MRSIIIAVTFFTLAFLPWLIIAADAMKLCNKRHTYSTCVEALR